MINLFDNFKRTLLGPAKNNANTYKYYNESARPDISLVRNKLEDWFSRLPLLQKDEMKSRFMSTFHDVFYELFLHELFFRLGFNISFHPDIPGVSTKPDFLICKNGIEIFVEAKISLDKSQSDIRSDNEYFTRTDQSFHWQLTTPC